MMRDPYFFGYGSLVNQDTHSFENAQPAWVKGWRRKWRHTNLREVAYLTVAPASGHEIAGLIASVPNNDWQALDIREHAYDRLAIKTNDINHSHPDELTVQMYRTKPGNDAPATMRHPILQSYLDTVVIGYLKVFGQDGARAFFETTDGWNAPVLDDRSDPIYPRAVSSSIKERAFIDAELDSFSVRRLGRASREKTPHLWHDK